MSLSALHITWLQKDEVYNEATDDSFRNAVAVMPLFARSVAAELREASDQVGEPGRVRSPLSSMHLQHADLASLVKQACRHHTAPVIQQALRLRANSLLLITLLNKLHMHHVIAHCEVLHEVIA